MRLLIVGPDEVYSIENFYAKYLAESGVIISRFTSQNLFYSYYHGSNIRKFIYRVGLSGIIRRINNLFKKHVDEFKPDVIWVFKGMEITPNSIRWSKSKGILVINYNPDNPFIFSGRGSGNKNIRKSITLYDLHFTYNLVVQKELKQKYNIDAEFLPFGFDIPESTFKECEKLDEVRKTCFLGNPDGQRATALIQLADKGVEIDVYGNHWRKFISHKNIQIFEPVHGEEFWKVLRKYRVQLNLMRIHNDDSHNMRSFEIPGIGGIQLAPSTTEHKQLFEEGKEIFLYSDIDECVQKVRLLLSLPQAEAMELRKSARAGAIGKGYSYYSRAKQVYNKLECLLKENTE